LIKRIGDNRRLTALGDPKTTVSVPDDVHEQPVAKRTENACESLENYT
jgi:hypothetical protein